MDKKRKSSTITSLILHIIVIWAAFSFKSANILVPSRSNGMEVSLITPEELKADETPSKIVTTSSQNMSKVTAKVADVNLKDNKKIEPPKVVPTPEAPKVVKKEVPKTPEKPKPEEVPAVRKTPPKVIDKPKVAKTTHAVKKKQKSNNTVNDLLSDLAPSKTAGHSANSATGGSDDGTADTNNLVGNYADKVIKAVKPYVVIPNDVTAINVAVVEVTLLPNLHVYNVQLVKSSGNDQYDQNVQDAINRVNIFPDLPDGAKFTEYRKLRLTFRAE
jgi:TonB family protein